MEPSNHPQTIALGHCYVCKRHFKNGVVKEEHHIIPRAYGGLRGPTVTLCADHHTLVHNLADTAITKWHPLLINLTPEGRKLASRLAEVIINAKAATSDDPNKYAVVNVTLNGQQKEMTDTLKSLFNLRSREAVLLKALEIAFGQFLTKD